MCLSTEINLARSNNAIKLGRSGPAWRLPEQNIVKPGQQGSATRSGNSHVGVLLADKVDVPHRKILADYVPPTKQTITFMAKD